MDYKQIFLDFLYNKDINKQIEYLKYWKSINETNYLYSAVKLTHQNFQPFQKERIIVDIEICGKQNYYIVDYNNNLIKQGYV